MKSPAGIPGGAFCVSAQWSIRYDRRMDTLPEKTPEQRIRDALARSEAQVAAGETVPLEPALQRLRDSIARMVGRTTEANNRR